MEKFLFTYIADVREHTMIRQSELTIKEVCDYAFKMKDGDN